MTDGRPENRLRQKRRIIIKILIVYFLLMGLWLLTSDKILQILIPERNTFIQLHIIKGWLTIIVSTAIFCFILYHYMRKVQHFEDALLINQQRYKSLIEQNPDVICAFDLNGKFIEVNPAVGLIGGYSEEDLLNQSFLTVVAPWDLEKVTECYENTLRGIPQFIEAAITHKKSHFVYMSIKTVPIIINRAVVGIYVIAKDITERRQDKLALEDSEKRLRTLINNMPDYVTFKDGEGRWLEANNYALKLLQLENISYRGKTHTELAYLSEGFSTFYCFVHTDQATWESGMPIRGLEKIKTADGTVRTFELTKVPVFYRNGERQGIITLARDISHQQMNENRLKESEQRLKSLFDHNSDAIFSLDQNGHFIGLNTAAEKLTGFQEKELINQSFYRGIVRKDRQKVKQHFQQSLQGKLLELEVGSYTKGGSQIELFVKTVPIIVDHQIVGIYAIARDITEQKRTNEFLQKTEKLSVVGQLAAGVAHEIRNPLTAVKGFIQLLQSQYKEHQPYFDVMLSEMDRINFIVTEFLYLAKPQITSFDKKDLRVLIQNIITLLQTQAILNNVQIRTEFQPEIPIILCGEDQLKQVFINILKNAMEAMPAGGEIVISMRLESDKLLIRFVDQGSGIPPERIPRLGEPFYTTKEKGTGLGLMISYRIVEAHKGTITINSIEGQGTTVDVILPIA